MEELLRKLKEMDLPQGKFAIFGSGPMCIRGLREPGDLDIIVTIDIYKDLKDRSDFKVGYRKKSRNEFLEKDKMEFYHNWHPEIGYWDVDTLIQDAEIIDDFPFVKLEEVLKWKQWKRREKDIKDIKLIEEYLKKSF